MALLFLDEMRFGEVRPTGIVSEGKLGVNLARFGSGSYGGSLFCHVSLGGLSLGLLHQSRPVTSIFGVLVVKVNEFDYWGEIIPDRDIHGVHDRIWSNVLVLGNLALRLENLFRLFGW